MRPHHLIRGTRLPGVAFKFLRSSSTSSSQVELEHPTSRTSEDNEILRHDQGKPSGHSLVGMIRDSQLISSPYGFNQSKPETGPSDATKKSSSLKHSVGRSQSQADSALSSSRTEPKLNRDKAATTSTAAIDTSSRDKLALGKKESNDSVPLSDQGGRENRHPKAIDKPIKTRWETWQDTAYPEVSSKSSNQVFKLTDKGVLVGVMVPGESGAAVGRVNKEISFTWLRDHCRCERCVQSSTSQKLHRTGDMLVEAPHEVKELKIQKGADGIEKLMMTMNDHEVEVPLKSLSPINILESDSIFREVYWKATNLADSPLRIPYSDLATPSTFHSATQQLIAYGIVIITGVPTEQTDDKHCSLREVVNKWGEIRKTFYGETWDVKSVKNSKNIAYTDVDLGLHMDLCYFENPPRYQALHCLRNRVEGGSSYFVDSFAAARDLYATDREAWTNLRNTLMPFVYDNDGYHYFYRHRTIECQSETRIPGTSEPRITAINYSPPFQGRWNMAHADRWATPDTEATPRSINAFEKLLDREEGRYEFTMREGDVVLFDNRRVLHARRSFKDREGGQDLKEGEATRWLKGCYMDGDVVRNKMRVLTRSLMNGEFEVKEEWKEWLRANKVLEHEKEGGVNKESRSL